MQRATFVVSDQQRFKRIAAREAPDNKLLSDADAMLEPSSTADARLIIGIAPLGHDAFEPKFLDCLRCGAQVSFDGLRQLYATAAREFPEQLLALVQGQAHQR